LSIRTRVSVHEPINIAAIPGIFPVVPEARIESGQRHSLDLVLSLLAPVNLTRRLSPKKVLVPNGKAQPQPG